MRVLVRLEAIIRHWIDRGKWDWLGGFLLGICNWPNDGKTLLAYCSGGVT